MAITFLILAFTVVVVGLAGMLASGGDRLRRRGDRDPAVIADSRVGFEADVGRTPPGP